MSEPLKLTSSTLSRQISEMESSSSSEAEVAAAGAVNHFVWPERAITEVQLFQPTAQPIVSITGFHMREDPFNKSYAVRQNNLHFVCLTFYR